MSRFSENAASLLQVYRKLGIFGLSFWSDIIFHACRLFMQPYLLKQQPIMADIITTVLVLTFIAALFTRVWYIESASDGISLDFIHFIFQCNIKKYIFYIFSIYMTAPLLFLSSHFYLFSGFWLAGVSLSLRRYIATYRFGVCSMQLGEIILKYRQRVWVFSFSLTGDQKK